MVKEMNLILNGKNYRVALAKNMKERALGMMKKEFSSYDGVLLCFPFRFWWGIWQASTEHLSVFYLLKQNESEFLLVSHKTFGKRPSFFKRWKIHFSLCPVKYVLELRIDLLQNRREPSTKSNNGNSVHFLSS